MTSLLFTPRGLALQKKKVHSLEEELHNLEVQTGEVTSETSETWHDNAAYDALVIDIRGKNWQLNGEVAALNKAVIVSQPISYDAVYIGTTVTLSRDGKEIVYHIGGYGEADLDQNIVSYNAPIIVPLMGKNVGFATVVRIGKGDAELEILSIQPCEVVKFFE